MSVEAGPAAPGSAVAGRDENISTSSIARKEAAHKVQTKQQRFLASLLEGPKTTRQLERAPVFDHCPHSTASELRRRGVEINTEMVEIPGYAGLPARVARYSLTDPGRLRAHQLLQARR